MIIKEKEDKKVKLSDIDRGTVFKKWGNYYMKTNEAQYANGTINAVALSEGLLTIIEESEEITLVDGAFEEA